MLANVLNFVLFIAIISNLLVGLMVLRSNKRATINTTFFALTVAITGWGLTNFFFQIIDNLHIKYILALLSYGFAALLALFFYKFCKVYSGANNNQKKYLYLNMINYAIAILALFISVIPGAVASSVNTNGAIVTNTWVLIIFGLALLMLFVQGLALLFTKIVKSNDKDRSSSLTILASFAVTVTLGLFFNLLFPINGNYSFVVLGPSATLVFVIGTAYAIFKYSLFDVRPILARSMAYAISIFFIVGVYSIFALVFTHYILGEYLSAGAQMLLVFATVVLAVLFHPIKKYFDKISNNIFYQDAYDTQKVLNKINSMLVNTLDLEALLASTAKIVEKELKVTYVDFYLQPKDSVELKISSSNIKLFASAKWHLLESNFDKSLLKSVFANNEQAPQNILKSMHDLRIEGVFKMSSGGDDVGYMLVGERKSGNNFSIQDRQLLEIITNEVAIAVQNALRFEEISQFNLTLQQKVTTATRQLQNSNDKLQKLDEAKDEFISMASHQLRTPLTSVKGYVSMVLEGDAGEINEQQRIFLNQALVSSQRMVYLIADLLNVSRLKTGKFLIETRPTYLPDVVESEVSQLYETAQGRGLTLKFTKPKTFPTISLDETKIRQVIMNFVDNAIYYTPKGGKITVGLKANPKSIEFTVADTGIGVSKQDQHKLFNKFYRAGNARKARPDGTGLGLYMAKKVVVAQGGAIIFETKENQGSVFGFTFPIPASK